LATYRILLRLLIILGRKEITMENGKICSWLKGFLALFLLFVLFYPFPAMSQGDYPTHAIKILLGHSAGGNTDLGLRILAEAASPILGQPVVVENKPGGNSYLAFVTAMNASPDGYTIADFSSMKYDLTVMYDKVPRKVEDATIIGCYWSIMHGVAVKADAPWKTLKELIEYARSHPGTVTYGVPNAGTPPHLAMILLAKKENIEWKVVPYQGLAPAIPALLGGHITFISGLAGAHLQQVKAGKMRLLAVTGGNRLPDFPDVPTLNDLGYGIEVSYDIGLGGPKGIEPPILQKLENAFGKAAKDPKFVNFVKGNNMVLTYMNSKQYTQYLKKNYEVRAPLIHELGLAYK
jgi:tripartite-type tricarboxylate transporter receptor subunit TctC